MKGSLPNLRMLRAGRAVRLESDKRLRVMVCYYLHIVTRQIGFVRAHLSHSEVAASSFHKSGELRTVISVCVRNLNTCDDVGFDAAHQVNLDPVVLFHEFWIGVFGLGPLNEAASGEAGRINGKVAFDGLQGQAAFLDQLFEERCQSGILKVARDRVVVRRSRQIPLTLRVFHVAHEATTGNGGVNLERAGENHISQGQARTPVLLDRLFNAFAQLSQQFEKAILFVSLRSVVGGPFLLIGFLDDGRFRVGLGFAVVDVLTLDDYFDCVDMFAGALPGREVRGNCNRV